MRGLGEWSKRGIWTAVVCAALLVGAAAGPAVSNAASSMLVKAKQYGNWTVGIKGVPTVAVVNQPTVTATQGGPWSMVVANSPTVKLDPAASVKVDNDPASPLVVENVADAAKTPYLERAYGNLEAGKLFHALEIQGPEDEWLFIKTIGTTIGVSYSGGRIEWAYLTVLEPDPDNPGEMLNAGTFGIPLVKTGGDAGVAYVATTPCDIPVPPGSILKLEYSTTSPGNALDEAGFTLAGFTSAQ